MSSSREIRLVENGDGEWSAIDRDAGVTGRGETRRQALENLDEAVALSDGAPGPIEDETAYLRQLGIDPADVEDTRELPDFLK